MERRNALITGGAGFIGWNLAKHLLDQGWRVMLYDCLDPQVHGPSRSWPEEIFTRLKAQRAGELPEQLQVYSGDIRNGNDLLTAMAANRPEVIFHLAAKVGVGQSAYQPASYVSANTTGTASMMDWLRGLKHMHRKAEELRADLVREDREPTEAEGKLLEDVGSVPDTVRKVFVAGSMSSYGEGDYISGEGLLVDGNDLGNSVRELESELQVVKAGENKPLRPASVYAMSKADTERYAVMIGEQNGIPVYVGRFFNVYGPGQALGNGYTGVVATFAGTYLRGGVPTVFEDGKQSRDLIHVADVVSAIMAIVEHGEPYRAYNVCTGVATSVRRVLEVIAEALDVPPLFERPSGELVQRVGDVRHCIGDPSALQKLGWEPKVRVGDGLPELCRWIRENPDHQVVTDQDMVCAELEDQGMLR